MRHRDGWGRDYYGIFHRLVGAMHSVGATLRGQVSQAVLASIIEVVVCYLAIFLFIGAVMRPTKVSFLRRNKVRFKFKSC